MDFLKKLKFNNLKGKFYEFLEINKNEIKNKEFLILFLRSIIFSSNFYIFFNIMEYHIIYCFLLCRYINAFFWDYLTAFHIGDYFRGYLINKESKKIIFNKKYIYIATLIDVYKYIKTEYKVFRRNRKNRFKKKIKTTTTTIKYSKLDYLRLFLSKLFFLLSNIFSEKNINNFKEIQSYYTNIYISIFQCLIYFINWFIEKISLYENKICLILIVNIKSLKKNFILYLHTIINIILLKKIKQIYKNIVLFYTFLKSFFKKKILFMYNYYEFNKYISILYTFLKIFFFFLRDYFLDFYKNMIILFLPRYQYILSNFFIILNFITPYILNILSFFHKNGKIFYKNILKIYYYIIFSKIFLKFFKKLLIIILYIVIYIDLFLNIFLNMFIYMYIYKYILYLVGCIKIKIINFYCKIFFKKVLIKDNNNYLIKDSVYDYINFNKKIIINFNFSIIPNIISNLFDFFCENYINKLLLFCVIYNDSGYILPKIKYYIRNKINLFYNYLIFFYKILFYNLFIEDNLKQNIIFLYNFIVSINIKLYLSLIKGYLAKYYKLVLNFSKNFYLKFLLNLINLDFMYYINILFEWFVHIKIILYNTNWDKVFLELRIYYVNKKRPWKQFKFDKSLYIIWFLDYIEYCMITHKKKCYGSNITKFHKKYYIVKKIPSLIEKLIKNYKTIFYKNLNIYIDILKERIGRILLLKININYNIFNYNFYNINIFNINYLNFILNILLNNIFLSSLIRLKIKQDNIFILILFKYLNELISKLNLDFNTFYKIIPYFYSFYYSFCYDYYHYNKIIKIFLQKNNKKDKINFLYNYKIKNYYLFFYSPFLILDYILSDFCLSITVFKNFYRRKKIVKKLFNSLRRKIVSFYRFLKYLLFELKLILKRIKKLIRTYIIEYIYLAINFIFRKTIYITFLCAYFLNLEFTTIVNKYYLVWFYNPWKGTFTRRESYRLWAEFDSLETGYKVIYPPAWNSTPLERSEYFYYFFGFMNSIFMNKNILQLLITIIGILLTLKWAKGEHRIYGNYLWTMTVFVYFLESHKVFYLKIFFLNHLSFSRGLLDLFLKSNFFEFLNFKFYNIYFFFYILLLILFLVYVIRHGGFMVVYANLRAPRWFYIKYPITVILIEIFRFKFIELVSIYIIYVLNKYYIYEYIFNIFLCIKNNSILIKFLYLYKTYIYSYDKLPYNYILQSLLVPNFYILNLIVDLSIIYVCLIWVTKYSKQYLKSDKKFVAFPVVACEHLIKYVLYFYIIYYNYLYWYIWISDGRVIYYGFYVLVFTFFYLEIRVHVLPKKTVAWYFRQITEFWPSLFFSPGSTTSHMRPDQRKYLYMRSKFKYCREDYSREYYKNEYWEREVISSFQRDKEHYLYIFSAFFRLMYRKEAMLREFNIYDYQGWQLDWEYNYRKIGIYSWKLDWWDKFHVHYLDKYLLYSAFKFYYFDFKLIMYRISCKWNFLTFYFWCINFLDYFYTNIYLYEKEHYYTKYASLYYDEEDPYNIWMESFSGVKHNLFWRSRKYKNLIREMKTKHRKKRDRIRDLRTLKVLKRILMEFSSGEREKTPDWKFPWVFEKQYSQEGWKMFENPEVDASTSDWRPDFEEW